MKNNNLIVSKADKCNCVTVIEKKIVEIERNI